MLESCHELRCWNGNGVPLIEPDDSCRVKSHWNSSFWVFESLFLFYGNPSQWPKLLDRQTDGQTDLRTDLMTNPCHLLSHTARTAKNRDTVIYWLLGDTVNEVTWLYNAEPFELHGCLITIQRFGSHSGQTIWRPEINSNWASSVNWDWGSIVC